MKRNLLFPSVLVVLGLACVCHAAEPPTNLAHHAKAAASSTFEARYAAANAVDGVVSDDSRWLSKKGDAAPWLELDIGEPRSLRCAHVYTGWEDQAGLASFAFEAWQDGKWQTIPGSKVTGNTAQAVTVTFEKAVTAQRVRFVSTEPGPLRVREIALFAEPAPLGMGVKIATGEAAAVPSDQHVIALNQVGFNTDQPKRFTAPLSADGSKFEVRPVGSDAALFSGQVLKGVGDFSAFKPADSAKEYILVVTGDALKPGQSDPFAIRANLYQEQFWQTAVDFMIDSRSVVGSHPSAYGGCPWRDGTYYDFIVPSLVEFYLADPARVQAMPRQIDWEAEKARLLSPDFKFDANNPHPEGVMDAARKCYSELESPRPDAPDVVKLIQWGLGYYLFHPATKDPSGDPAGKKIHSQTVEQFAFVLWAWPKFDQWLSQSFYQRCRDFTFEQWKKAGLLEIDPQWDAQSYLTPEQILEANPTGGTLHPYKGRHAPGHSIQPNLLLYEVAKREKRADADDYLKAAQTQAEWVIVHVDWNDPRTTKGQRMSEFKTMTGLVWFLQNHPSQAPAGLKSKITDWARVAIQRSENFWDFRRYDLDQHWTIPKLNETGNLVSFTAAALAASWVVDDAGMKRRLQEIAVAQMDDVFGRNPKLAAAPEHPEKGFPLIERGWPKKFQDNTCARLETTRGALSSSPGTEMYPFNPGGKYRHLEGWVNYNAAWNVALAYVQWNRKGHAP